MASNELLQGLIETTLAGSVAALLVLVLRRPMRAAFGAQVAYALWLLLPLALLATLLPAATVAVERLPAARVPALPTDFAVPAAAVPQAIDGATLLLALWLLGALAGAGWLWHAQAAFRRGLGPLLAHGDALRAQVASAGLPATLGLWRPQVVLPADFETRFDASQQALVLAHERRHVARFDPWANAAAALLRCLFWFNPLFHLAAARMRHDQELACDADVLAAHPQQRRRYGDALLNAQLALQTAPLGCHFGFGHPLKERIAMLAHSVSTTRRWLGRAALACLLLGGGYAVWAAQPPVQAAPAAASSSRITADIVLQVDEDAPRPLRIVSEVDKPFSLETNVDGKRFAIAGSVARVEHQHQPALALQMHIDENGKRIAEPKLIVLSGNAAAIQLGSEVVAEDGNKTFKGLRLDVTLTDAAAGGVTLQRNQTGLRDMVSNLARDRGMTVSGLELIPEQQKVSMSLNGVPLETVLALVGDSMALEARVIGKRIELTRKLAAPAAPPAPPAPPQMAVPPLPAAPPPPPPPKPAIAALQSGSVDSASRALHPPRYPAEALKEGKTGVTLLVVDIDARGGVTGVKVERSSGDARLDLAAQDAAAKWRFTPATKKGRPVAGKVRVPVEFALDGPTQQAG